jgi:hypothetical protein
MSILGQQNAGVYRTENVFTTALAQTVFACQYDPRCIEVYKNGIRLTPLEYTANDGHFIDIPTALENDVVYIICYKTQIGQTYILTASAALTLPPEPLSGWAIRIINASGTTTSTVLANGNKIQGDVNDITIDILNSSMTLTYLDNIRGWWIS